MIYILCSIFCSKNKVVKLIFRFCMAEVHSGWINSNFAVFVDMALDVVCYD